MSLTVQEIFDIRVPEIVSDPVEMEKLNKFVDYVNNLGLSNGYGAQMNLAVALYSLHLYYLDKAKNNKSGITAGMVKSEKSYRYSRTMDNGTNGQSDGWWDLTIYGREFKQIPLTGIMTFWS